MTGRLLLAAAVATAAPAPALADTNAPPLDPNEVICRTVSATGSRLAASRRCATRAQWLEDERAQRAWIAERQVRQTQPSCLNPAERARTMGRYYAGGGTGAGGC
ncbi:MAG TPA: hypothetical protein VGW40_06565 [Allosphingosinicella sp.]|nr:hypothetical protein [Allosphingosinicella sp.]